jgi:hypothetical protein
MPHEALCREINADTARPLRACYERFQRLIRDDVEYVLTHRPDTASENEVIRQYFCYNAFLSSVPDDPERCHDTLNQLEELRTMMADAFRILYNKQPSR